MRTDAELKQLAQDFIAGTIWTDRHCHSPKDLTVVFLPLGFLDKPRLEALAKEIGQTGFIYQHLSKAGPRAINGMPIFTSYNIVTAEEGVKVFDYIEKIRTAVESL